MNMRKFVFCIIGKRKKNIFGVNLLLILFFIIIIIIIIIFVVVVDYNGLGKNTLAIHGLNYTKHIRGVNIPIFNFWRQHSNIVVTL
jgi:hypothetical protein